jgi:hypothetical protein
MPLLWLSLAYLAGLALGGSAPPALRAAWPWLAAGLPVTWLLLRLIPARLAVPGWLRWLVTRDARLRLPPVLLAITFTLGAWQVSTALPAPKAGEVGALNDQGRFRLVGVVSEPPERREETSLARLTVESAAPLAPDGKPGPMQATSGALLVMVPGPVDWQYGDRLALEGRPVTPPANEEFSYRDTLARQGIYSYLAYPRVERLASGAGSPLLARHLPAARAGLCRNLRAVPGP